MGKSTGTLQPDILVSSSGSVTLSLLQLKLLLKYLWYSTVKGHFEKKNERGPNIAVSDPWQRETKNFTCRMDENHSSLFLAILSTTGHLSEP